MGSILFSSTNGARKRTSVKLQEQQVPTFNSNPLMWYTWKKKTQPVGILSILDDEEYVTIKNQVDKVKHLL